MWPPPRRHPCPGPGRLAIRPGARRLQPGPSPDDPAHVAIALLRDQLKDEITPGIRSAARKKAQADLELERLTLEAQVREEFGDAVDALRRYEAMPRWKRVFA